MIFEHLLNGDGREDLTGCDEKELIQIHFFVSTIMLYQVAWLSLRDRVRNSDIGRELGAAPPGSLLLEVYCGCPA